MNLRGTLDPGRLLAVPTSVFVASFHGAAGHGGLARPLLPLSAARYYSGLSM
ncbi:hypothetical protein [Variovorax sp. RCC_210]|uniref:hypothetical protein n=1 Tax=Variovorax sp. RCC_210 TaxID=3239217 RepID=UPI0014030B3C